jgi:phospholipid-binding lipoprotein MlaA
LRTIRVAALLAASLLTACATTPGHQLAAERDPYEKTNRGIYKFNRAIDKAAVKPATKVYRAVVLKAAQRGITNFFNNVDEPFSFINSLLQGKVEQAMRTFGRFAINTTLGVGGLADHATDMGLPEEPEDFGQTLGVWGVNSGPYLMLPFFGPSTIRDAVGFGVERVGDPFRIAVGELKLSTTESIGATGLELADTRSYVMDTADPLLEGSADEYATVRSAFLQYRLNLIYDGAPPEDEEDMAPPPAATPPANPAAAPEGTQPVTPGESAPPPSGNAQPETPATTPAPEAPAAPAPTEPDAAPDATNPAAPEQPKP